MMMMNMSEMNVSLAYHAALGKTVEPIIQDICPMLEKMCALGEALCHANGSIFMQQVETHVGQGLFAGELLLSCVVVVLLIALIVLMFMPIKVFTGKARGRWHKIWKDMRNRSKKHTPNFARDFFKDGDIHHGLLVLRYLHACGVRPDGFRDAVTFEHPSFVTIDPDCVSKKMNKHFFTDSPSNDTDMVWKYALGCLRHCKKESDHVLYRALEKIATLKAKQW